MPETTTTEVPMGHWRITPAWLCEREACAPGLKAAGDRTLTVVEAVTVALDYQHSDWAQWVLAEVLRDVPQREVVRFTCRRARSVPQGPAGEAAIGLAERWAAGDDAVTAEALREAADAAEAAEAAWAAADAAARAAVDVRASWLDAAEDAQAVADRYLGVGSGV